MIITVEELMEMSEFSGISESYLKSKLDAIEQLIRAYTNNNFQNRLVRFSGASIDNMIYGTSEYLKVGDTVQISASVNSGLYVVSSIENGNTYVDSELFATDFNLVTKVEYPANIVSGVIDLLLWEIKNRQKVGIKQESLSRHSVTYYDQDSNNTVMGYPVSLLGFLKPYMKARF